jgi:hypothetical protein
LSSARDLELRVRDDGKGIHPEVAAKGKPAISDSPGCRNLLPTLRGSCRFAVLRLRHGGRTDRSRANCVLPEAVYSHRGNFDVWRRKRDSNPRVSYPTNGFQDRRLQPLGHSSAFYLTRWRLSPKEARFIAMALIGAGHVAANYSAATDSSDPGITIVACPNASPLSRMRPNWLLCSNII